MKTAFIVGDYVSCRIYNDDRGDDIAICGTVFEVTKSRDSAVHYLVESANRVFRFKSYDMAKVDKGV